MHRTFFSLPPADFVDSGDDEAERVSHIYKYYTLVTMEKIR